MSRYNEADLSRLTRICIGERGSKVAVGLLAGIPEAPCSFADLWDSLPDILGAASLRALARAIVTARAKGRPVIWMFGAHAIKVGLGPILNHFIEEDLATLLAVNGAFTIHDAELALWGKTSEEVAAELHAGRFGMAQETAAFINTATARCAEEPLGLGEAIGQALAERAVEQVIPSVLGTCHGRGIPVTVHLAIGTDITHQHPEFSGAAAGAGSARDFRILAAHLDEVAGAVVVNVGSAVILPEVFLKALSVAINLGARVDGLVTATFDFQRHYRPMENVIRRPVPQDGQGHYIVGHHEILLPPLLQGLLLERGRLGASAAG